MGISIDKLSHHAGNVVQPLKSNGTKTAASVQGRKFDEVMISSNASQIQEKKISESLEKKVLSQIQKQPSPEVIQSLKNAVADGTYKVNVDRVAASILLQGGSYDNA